MRKQYHFWPGAEGRDAWDVDRLIQLAADLPIEHVNLDEIGEIDLAHPVILGPDGRVMDGMHRIGRALLDRSNSIKAVRLASLPEPDFRNCRPDELPYN